MTLLGRFLRRWRNALAGRNRLRIAAGSTFVAADATLVNAQVRIDGGGNRIVLEEGDTIATDIVIDVEGGDNAVSIGSGGRLNGTTPDVPFL